MKHITTIILCSVLLLACGKDRKAMLMGAWHATRLENAQMDSFFYNSQKYIDTMGKGHDAATNIAIYGVANMDSVREVMQAQYNSAKDLQLKAVTNTAFIFMDTLASISFDQKTDTSHWYLEGNNTLLFDNFDGQGKADRVKMEILSLSDSIMKLKLVESGETSIITLRHE